LPNEADLSALLPFPWNQGTTASGVAHAFAGAITVALATHGRPLSSPAWPRNLLIRPGVAELSDDQSQGCSPGYSQATPLVTDTGVSPWWTIRALRAIGIPICPTETLEMDVRGAEYAAFLASKINEPPFDLGLVNSPLDFHAIVSPDESKINQIVSALATGYPVLGAVDTKHPAFKPTTELESSTRPVSMPIR